MERGTKETKDRIYNPLQRSSHPTQNERQWFLYKQTKSHPKRPPKANQNGADPSAQRKGNTQSKAQQPAA